MFTLTSSSQTSVRQTMMVHTPMLKLVTNRAVCATKTRSSKKKQSMSLFVHWFCTLYLHLHFLAVLLPPNSYPLSLSPSLLSLSISHFLSVCLSVCLCSLFLFLSLSLSLSLSVSLLSLFPTRNTSCAYISLSGNLLFGVYNVIICSDRNHAMGLTSILLRILLK